MTATLLFDLDGTLVETDHLHFEAFKSVFAGHGIAVDWETYRTRVIGKANPDIAAEFLPHLPVERHGEIMDSKEAAYRALVGEVQPATGLIALLDWAHTQGIRSGVVTNAPRANADLLLASLKIRERFDVLVIGPELAEAKPHPMPYRRGLELLGGDAEHSCGFEDSPSGTRSAVAAGLGVAGLTTSVEPGDLLAAGAHLTAPDFADPALVAFVKARTGLA